jgi:Dolichyl-phosphate-mannose-protein mannosyltransferase
METRGMVQKYSGTFEWDCLEKTSDSILICIPVLLLLIVTLPYIVNGYWEDEIFSITTARSWSGLFVIFRDYENNMSLYYVILHGLMRIFGEGEVATHSLSLLFAILTIPVFFRLERVWLNKSTSLWGGLLLAANPLFVFYAVESRSYSLLILSATISTLIFLSLVRKPGFLLAIYYGLSIAIGIYIHYFGILLILVHILTMSRKNLTRLHLASYLLSGLVIFLGVLPLLLFPPRNKGQINWILKPDLKYLWYTLRELFGGGWVFLVLIMCLFFVAKKGYWKYATDRGYFLPRLAVAWAILPASLLFLFSNLVKPVFLTRFFVWCLPGAVLLTCLIVSYTGWGHFRKSVVWSLLLFILLIKSHGILRTKGSGYKEAVQYLNEHILPGESVLAYPYYKAGHVAYYLDKIPTSKPFARPIAITKMPYMPGGGGRDPDPDMETLRKVATESGKVYLICSEREGLTITDSILNRTWLPEIQKILFSKHPKQHGIIFGVGSQQAIRIIIYE